MWMDIMILVLPLTIAALVLASNLLAFLSEAYIAIPCLMLIVPKSKPAVFDIKIPLSESALSWSLSPSSAARLVY